MAEGTGFPSGSSTRIVMRSGFVPGTVIVISSPIFPRVVTSGVPFHSLMSLISTLPSSKPSKRNEPSPSSCDCVDMCAAAASMTRPAAGEPSVHFATPDTANVRRSVRVSWISSVAPSGPPTGLFSSDW